MSTGAFRLHWAACPGELTKIQNPVLDWSDPDFFFKNLKATIEGLPFATDSFDMCGYMQLQERPAATALHAVFASLRTASRRNVTMGRSGQLTAPRPAAQEDPCVQLIEDPGVNWETRPHHVFTLSIPRQGVGFYNEFCDNTVYNPCARRDR